MNSHCFKLYRSYSIHLICGNVGKIFGGTLNPKGPYQSLEKAKGNFCVVFTYFIKRAREIRNRSTPANKCTKKRDARAKFLLLFLLFFAVLVAVAVVVT